jgi:hypothetical protein
MIIGVTSHLPYAEFFARLAPAAAVALVLTIGLIGLLRIGSIVAMTKLGSSRTRSTRRFIPSR